MDFVGRIHLLTHLESDVRKGGFDRVREFESDEEPHPEILAKNVE